MLTQPELQRKIKRFKSVVTDLALEKNLLSGHYDYTKFIILCRSKTGSNLLVDLLQSHSQLRLFSELFSEEYSEKTCWDFINQDLDDIWLTKQNNPAKFIDEHVFRAMPKSISAVGFKLFYHHARTGKTQAVWNYLKNDRKIKVIHLRRKNILKTYVSQQMAFRTNAWISRGKAKVTDNFSISLDYRRVIQAFEQTRQWEQKCEQFFAEHQLINVIYEDLVKNYQQETKQIQDFLNVDYQPLYISTRKQSKQKLSDQIANYAELKQKFADTPWSEFFE